MFCFIGEWKVRDIQMTLEALNENCSELRGLNISGWKGLNADNIKYISSEFQKLERLDLSSINVTTLILFLYEKLYIFYYCSLHQQLILNP